MADKKYQLADWRTRPLPADMLKYAREDTHYLLHIYDRMRMELLERGTLSNPENPRALLRAVMHQSGSLCLKVYEKPTVKDFKYYEIVAKNSILQTEAQNRVLKLLLKYRDYVARLDDESPQHMLP
jgi:exosome complex exonuclease RRP6